MDGKKNLQFVGCGFLFLVLEDRLFQIFIVMQGFNMFIQWWVSYKQFVYGFCFIVNVECYYVVGFLWFIVGFQMLQGCNYFFVVYQMC